MEAPPNNSEHALPCQLKQGRLKNINIDFLDNYCCYNVAVGCPFKQYNYALICVGV